MRLLAPAPTDTHSGVSLDGEQARAVAAAFQPPGLLLAGAPGTGKTTTSVQIAIQQLNLPPRGAKLPGQPAIEPLLFLAPTRRVASELRSWIAPHRPGPATAPIVRTASSFAFAVLTQLAQLHDDAPPKLISGPEQDRIIADLLQGHLSGDGLPLQLPPELSLEALSLRGFRHELRDLMMRAREYGVSPGQLAELGRRHRQPMWVLGAQLYGEYEANLALRNLSLRTGRQYDPAEIIGAAAEALANWPELSDAPPPRFDMVIVDDYQEATAATAQLLTELQNCGSRLVIAGDPSLTTQSFRGADPALLGRCTAPRGSGIGNFGLPTIVLPTVWRSTEPIRQAVVRVTSRIPTSGAPLTLAATARPITGEPPDRSEVQAAKFRGTAQQSAWIARTLREEHYLRGTPWEQMVVICRSGALLADLRRELIGAGVPVATIGADVPLHLEPAVLPLLTVLRLVTGLEAVSLEVIQELLTSPIGGMDAIDLRRLRQTLLSQERQGDGNRNSGQLLVAALQDDALRIPLGQLGQGLERVAAALSAGAEALSSTSSVASVLWAIWDATGLSEAWRTTAIAGGSLGVKADRDLDALMALFKAAEFFGERNPGAGPERFIEYLASQDVPADSVAARAATGAVAALTPTGAAGGQWEVVVVAGVQEGVWPDLRLRDSLFGTQLLVDVITGRVPTAAEAAGSPDVAGIVEAVGSDDAAALTPLAREIVAARAAVLADETRTFTTAISRARRRLLVTAVETDEESPSVFLDFISDEIPLVEPDSPLDLRGVVASARLALLQAETSEQVAQAAQLLADLQVAGVSAADPAGWSGVLEISTAAPVWKPDQQVRVSPSKVESVNTCPLRWAFESAGATRGVALPQSVGNLIHQIAQALPEGTQEQLQAELDQRWPELDLPEGWIARRQRYQAEEMIRRLAEYLKDAAPAVALESELNLTVGPARLHGFADRIEQVGQNTYQLVDLKTGTRAPSREEAEENPQLQTYQLALLGGGFTELPQGANSGGARLLYVSNINKGPKIVAQAPLDEARKQACEELVVDTARIMAASTFEARSNDNCKNCGVRFACPLQPEAQRVL